MGQCQSCQKSVPAGSFPPSHVHVTTLQSKDTAKNNSVRRIHYPYSPPSNTSNSIKKDSTNSLVIITTTSSSTVPHDEQQADAQQQQQHPGNLLVSPFSTDSTANLSHWTASPPLSTAAGTTNSNEQVEEEVPSDEEAELEEEQPPALSSNKSVNSLQTWNASNPPPSKQAVHPQALDAFALLKQQVEQQQQQERDYRPIEPSSCLTHTVIQPSITTTSTNTTMDITNTHKLPGSFVTVRHHDDDAHSLVSDLGDEASWTNQSWGRGAFRKNNDYGVQRRTNDAAYTNSKDDHHQQIDPRFSAALQANLGISNPASFLTARLDRIEEALAATATPCKQDTDNSTQATPIIHNTSTQHRHLESTLGTTLDNNDDDDIDMHVWESPTNGNYYPTTTTRGHDESPDDELTPLKRLSKQQHDESFQSSLSDAEPSQSVNSSSDQLESMQVNISTTSDPMDLPSLSLTPLLFTTTSAASENQIHAANISSESDDSSDQLASIVQNDDDSMSAHYTSPYAVLSFNNHSAEVNVSMDSSASEESSNASATGTSDPDTSQRSTVSLPMDVLSDNEDERSCWTAPMRQASPIIQPGNTARRARMLEANNRRADDTPGAPLRSKSFMELRSWAQASSSTPASPSSSCASSVNLDQSPETAADVSNQSLSLDLASSRQYSPPRPLYPPRGQERRFVCNNTPITSTTTVVPAPRTEPSRWTARLDGPHDGTTTTTPLHTLPLRSQSWSTTAKRGLLLRGGDLESARKSLLLADRVEAQVKEVLTKYRNEKPSPVCLP